MSTRGGQKASKGHIFGPEWQLKSKSSAPQAGKQHKIILSINEQQWAQTYFTI